MRISGNGYFEVALLLAIASLLFGCADETLSCRLNPNIVDPTSDASPIHDPAMIKMNNTYYVYSSSDLGAFL